MARKVARWGRGQCVVHAPNSDCHTLCKSSKKKGIPATDGEKVSLCGWLCTCTSPRLANFRALMIFQTTSLVDTMVR